MPLPCRFTQAVLWNAAYLEVLWLQRASSLTCSMQVVFPAVRCVLLVSCRAVGTRTGQGLGHSRRWGAALGGGGSACLQKQLLQKMDPHFQLLSCASLITRPQVTLLPPLSQPGGFMSKKLQQGSGKADCFPQLGSFSCGCISGYSAQYSSPPTPPSLPSKTQTTEWQREVKSRMTFSAKPLLKIPGKLISFSPCSAIATFFSPKTSCLPVAKLGSIIHS